MILLARESRKPSRCGTGTLAYLTSMDSEGEGEESRHGTSRGGDESKAKREQTSRILAVHASIVPCFGSRVARSNWYRYSWKSSTWIHRNEFCQNLKFLKPHSNLYRSTSNTPLLSGNHRIPYHDEACALEDAAEFARVFPRVIVRSPVS